MTKQHITKFRPFPQARVFVHQLGLKNSKEWREYRKSDKRPDDIPSHPENTYGQYWKGMGDWLGTYHVKDKSREYRGFSEARKFVQSLGLRNEKQWREYLKSGKKPCDIPSKPERQYRQYWKGFGDWLGTGRVADQFKVFRSFDDARQFVHSLGIEGRTRWYDYCRSGRKPAGIPTAPDRKYKNEWKGWGDWLGTGTLWGGDIEYGSFEEAREFIHNLGLKNRTQWREYCKSGEKPRDIPATPEETYEKEWKGFGDWLGTGRIADKNKVYRNFTEAREYVHNLGLKTTEDWLRYRKSDKKPQDIPAGPERTYKNEWRGVGDWLGTGRIANREKQYRSFEQAQKLVHSLNLESREQWVKYTNSGKKPDDVPSSPDAVYQEEWKGWGDWLGTGIISTQITGWSIDKVKELLSSLIESKVIYQWNEAVLYSFLLRKGVLNLNLTSNRHAQFFKNLIEASRTEQGRKAIEDYVNSESENPPDLSTFVSTTQDPQQEIQKATAQELAGLVGPTDPLDYGDTMTAQVILSNTNILESINVDQEAMQFYLDYSIDELWKRAFRDQVSTVAVVKKEGKNGNKYHDAVLEAFVSDYEGTQNMEIPKGYSFPYPPTLMQLYVAYKVRVSPYFGNFSGTGAGKTLSAVLAGRIIESKMTVIVCPNDVVDQWAKNVSQVFPDSKVITRREAFYAKYDESKYQYLVLNYDKFSQEDSPNLILDLVKQKVDFIILDEIHFVKKGDEVTSQRRQNLDGLITAVRKKNEKVKVLGLSATPVVNNLMEERSLLELITGKAYEDVATRPTIPYAVTLYEKLSTISIRELPQYNIDLHTDHIDVEASKPQNISIKHLKSNPLSIEQFLTDARIPEIVMHIEGQTIIYTEYVTDVIEKLSKAVSEAGHSFALYTGSDHSGLSRFLKKKVQVLIASRPISVGVDGLQHICNRLIINTLPWTNAQYQQLLGRLVRKGQIRDVVNVYVIKASISGYSYDQLKWNRIQFKRTLADCAVDGRLPEKNLVTPQQAAMEAVKWLERLERGEISSVVRRDLNVELTPVQIEQRIRRYGDFTRLNQQINSETSKTTHDRLLKDPKEWEEYHRQYREARKTWSIIPYEVIVKRIKELSPRLQVGDFGCGEAKIMEAIGENRVNSFDHVAINNKITACDMKSVPLPDEALDIVVFSLSLMGKNWQDYIREATRCLATNGYLLIAETANSLKGRLSKLREILTQQGYEIYSDEEKGNFTFIEAREL